MLEMPEKLMEQEYNTICTEMEEAFQQLADV